MDTNKIWKEVLSTLKVSVSSAHFSTLLPKTFIYSTKSGGDNRQIIEVACPSSFIADSIEKRYSGLIQDALERAIGEKCNVVFVVRQVVSDKKKEIEYPLFFEKENAQNINHTLKRSRIRPGFTFENFAVSSTNQMAWAAAEAVSKNLGSAYNPLFLWGGVGVGKTHLMLAIAHRVLSQDSGLPVLYCMGDEFTSEIVQAIKNKNTQEFKNRYRNLKLLLLDDIQFIAGKKAVQEEFFHTFNTLLREGGQVVMTSDRPPSEITELEARLKSRFEAGLIIDISPPDFELLAAIALIKAQEKGIELSTEVAQVIAANFDNPRKIEGFLTRLTTETTDSEQVNIALIEKVLGKTGGNGIKAVNKAIGPQVFVDAVSNYYSIGKRRLLGEGRMRPIVEPRQLLMYLLRMELDLPLQEVGRIVGGRDHTTVIHAVDKISKKLSTSAMLRKDLLGIKQVVSG